MFQRFYSKTSAAIVIVGILTVLGIYQFATLPIALYPRTTKPTVEIRINTEGTNADEFMRRYGFDMEESLQNISGVELVKGSYRNGNSRFYVTYGWGKDPDQAQDEVRSAIQRFQSNFPDHWRDPNVGFADSDNSAVYVAIKESKDGNEDLQALVERAVIPKLRSINGISGVWIDGPERKTINITIDPDKLAAYGLTYKEVRDKLREREYNETLGTIQSKYGSNLLVISNNKFMDLAALNNTIFATHDKRPVRLRDIGEAKIDFIEPNRTFTISGEKALMVEGEVDPDANLRDTSAEFIETLEREIKQLDPTLSTEVLINPAMYIEDAVSDVIGTVIAAIIITTLVVFIFLGNILSTAVICLAIPLCLIGGFILMDVFGIELNLVSLGAMALAVGMVVDASTVVVENISRHMSESKGTENKRYIDVISLAIREIQAPLTASILTSIIVFAPLPFTAPLASALLGDLAIVVVCTMIVSLFVSLLFIPSFYYLFAVRLGYGRKMEEIREPHWYTKAHDWYLKFVERILNDQKTARMVVGFSVLAFVVAVWAILTQVPRKIMDEAQTNIIRFYVEISDDNIEIAEKSRIIARHDQSIREAFKDDLQFTLAETCARCSSLVWLFLKDPSDSERIREELVKKFPDTPMLKYEPEPWAPSSLQLPNPSTIRIYATTGDPDEKRKALERIREILRGPDEVLSTRAEPRTSTTQTLVLNFNEEALARHGYASASDDEKKDILAIDDLKAAVTGSLRDERLYTREIGGKNYSVNLRTPEAYRESLEDIGNLLINANGKVIPLRSVADISRTREWNEYTSTNGQDEYFVEAWTADKDKGMFEWLKKMVFDEASKDSALKGISLRAEYPQEEINQNLSSLLSAFALASMLIAIVIVIQFGSFRQTALIFIAIPLGIIGVGLALWIFQSNLGINSMLGTILLAGTAVNNSIMMVEVFTQKLETGAFTPKSAALEAARLRLRPIILTVATTIIGDLPVAFGFGSGGKVLQPLGIAVCGGLWISTALTVLIVPLACAKVYERKQPSPNVPI